MDYKNIKISFFGTPELSAQILSTLILENFKICAVLTQSDKINGRGLNNNDSPVKKIAIENNLELFQPDNKYEIVRDLAKIKPELLIVVGYGHILTKEALAVPKYGAINIHGSLLPKYRGSSPIQTSILNGDKKTGVTFIKMNPSMDEGDIIYQDSIGIDNQETASTLTHKISEVSCQNIERVIRGYLDNTLVSKKQDKTKATYCQLISKNDGLINWQDQAIAIDRKVRAYNSWPTAFTFWQTKKISILESVVSKQVIAPGLVCIHDKKLFVGTEKDSLEIIKLQLAGKKNMTAIDFINGHKDIDNCLL